MRSLNRPKCLPSAVSALSLSANLNFSDLACVVPAAYLRFGGLDQWVSGSAVVARVRIKGL